MGGNQFGKHFTFTTYGQSHGQEMGVVIDGCPAGLAIDEEEIMKDLAARRPGRGAGTSARAEKDHFEIRSGLFEGKSTGAPIAIGIANQDVRSADYDNAKQLHRPGHASYTYYNKYGIEDYRGGGRASGRETVCRVAAGAIASMLLKRVGIEVGAALVDLQGSVSGSWDSLWDWEKLREQHLFSLDQSFHQKAMDHLKSLEAKGESCGGIVVAWAKGVPCGLGEPVYEKLPALLASAMFSIPAVKGFWMGDPQAAISLEGSCYRDELCGQDRFATNHCGGVLGGISTGQTLYCSVVFKPTSSTKKSAKTHRKYSDGEDFVLTTWKPQNKKRHDPCIAIRAVPVVRSMLCCVLADRILAYSQSRVDLYESLFDKESKKIR